MNIFISLLLLLTKKIYSYQKAHNTYKIYLTYERYTDYLHFEIPQKYLIYK